ncbi:BamA/TamA family outer membrane protein [Sulfurovum sp. XTW-4]|uniref:BamA/TamA family outer membrane protein n=1 Tax=Sulfurovum xiamenensis TaxID=3019066 RepID=A0ABT7QP05_9BACT|nr:BamA/TamA family outer membrane protein [Sulfurovum xiamenensis]MDM5262604.1 BamA/TamA family outer membrane protein [Sulfurovum xiamenensis]
MRHTFTFCLIICISTLLFADEIELPTHEIHFSGQKYFEESDLQDALGVTTPGFFQFWKDNTPRIKDKLIPSLKPSLKSFYDSEGFYDANFTIQETNTTVFVTISENEPVRVRDINISSDYNISTMVTMKKDDIFRAETFIAIKSKMIAGLLKEGYCSYDLDTKAYVDLDLHTVDLRYVLRKGGICTFGKLTTSGLETIDEDVIRSRVKAKEGQKYSTDLIQDTSNRLYGLNAFDSVIIDVDRKFYNVVPVDITFTEMEKPYHLEAGAGYDTYVGMRVLGEITKHNFMGNAQELKLQTSWSQREQLIKLGYFKPAFLDIFGYYTDLGGNTGYSNLEFDGFKEEKAFLRAYLEHEHKRLRLRAGVALENIVISALENLDRGVELSQAVTEGTFPLLYPYVDLVYDARDSKLNPKYGYYLSAYGEFGLSYDEEASVYMKTLFEGRFIHTFADLTLAAVGKVGIVDVSTENGLPESKYFFGGGAYSNRAYGFRELGVIISPTEDSIYGASTMANLSLEANYPVWGDIYGALFTDNTMLTEESYNFKGEIISAVGLGARYMTPIGPFKLDIGFNVNDFSQYGISFQIGQSF